MVIKFTKELHQQSNVLVFPIDNPKSSIIFGPAGWFLGSKAGASSTDISLAPQAVLNSVFSDLIQGCIYSKWVGQKIQS